RLDEQGRTQTGAVMGTPSYMAPEQANGDKSVGPAADVYALGAILYECLTGRPPFKAATMMDTILQVVADEPVPPRQLQSTTPKDLETICLKCLHKSPSQRYLTAAQLAEDLEHFQQGEPIAARPSSTWERSYRWAKRRPAVAALLAVGFLAVAGGLAGILWHNAQLQEALMAEANAKAGAQQQQQEATRGRDEARRHLYYAALPLAQQAWKAARIGDALEL